MRREHEYRVNDRLPRELAELLRPGLEELAMEICTEIRVTIPEYARAGEGPRPTMRPAVEQAITTFVDRIADPGAPLDRLAEVCHTLGEKQAAYGNSLDSVQAALRIAFRIALHRCTQVCERHRLPAEVMARLAEAQLEYLDELASLSVEGYLEAQEGSPDDLAKLRQQLLQLIMERPEVPLRTITELAEHAGWTVPAEVTMVAVRPGARWVRSAGGEDVLLDLDSPEPRLLLPGRLDDDRRAMLETALPRDRIAVGLTVPLEQAPDSLRWARQALALAEEGIIDDARVTLCEDNLLNLWLMTDPALIDELTQARLAGLANLSAPKRQVLTDTLRVWLEAWSTAAEVGARMHVHPQTVRYRLKQLKDSLGDRITDPESRFGLELALRGTRLRDRGRRANGSGTSSLAS